jgi:ADP-dependent NAD(P)H-hydrate dehydratase / NAD(P)H-hydrate epimerase
MAQADRLAMEAGTPGIVLMENAGRAVANAVASRCPSGAAVTVVAGPGNNGGDGFVAARLLVEAGYAVRLVLVGDRARLRGDAALAAQRWQGSVEAPVAASLSSADVIVDALFGAGLDRDVDGVPRAMIEAINDVEAPVVAVDLPSGINGATGAVMGAAVRATRTVTFFRRKPGHLLLPGRLHCGEVQVADIGIRDDVLVHVRPSTFVNEPALWKHLFPVPRIDGHKYSRGHAVIVSGGLSYTGAARLAARGALRAGAGLVTIASPREALAVNAASNLAIMVGPVDGPAEFRDFLADTRRNAVVLGPGGGVGRPMCALVDVALDGARSVVLDADALTSFADEPQALARAINARRGGATVLTPHEGEFSRMLSKTKEVAGASSKLERSGAAAKYLGAVLLLKGADTVVAAPDGRASILENGTPWLATAGAGDVLAGIIGALLAQGTPGFEAASAGAWLHAEAGRLFGPGLTAEDLPEILPDVYRRLLQ